jgi:hypothetical protein
VRQICTFALAVSLLAFSPLPAQNLPYRQAAMERLIVVLPMAGAGTASDPKRPWGIGLMTYDPSAPVGFHYILSDDGHFAIVELTAGNVKHFTPVLGLLTAIVNKFDPRVDSRASVESVLKLIRKDFDLPTFLTGSSMLGVRP